MGGCEVTLEYELQGERELRDDAFSFGGLELTRQIVRRFCDLPEVRPLLPQAGALTREQAEMDTQMVNQLGEGLLE